MRRILPTLLLLSALLLPREARGQVDAIINAVADVVEPTPVYDEGLREATEHLASKIDRLNHVLFGGAEETSAAYRYMKMYSELYELTTAFTSYVERSYRNAVRLEQLYRQLDRDDSLHDWAGAVETTWHTYDNTVRVGSTIVERFKRLFSDPNTTNAEVRAAAREAIDSLEKEQASAERQMERELEATALSAGLVECAALLDVSPAAYVAEGKRTYGTAVSEGDSGDRTGTLGTAVMVVIGLLCTVYALFAAIHVMKGTHNAENIIVRLIVFVALSLIIIIAIQHFL